MKHAILGPGGVGGLVGACLAHEGEAVTVVVRKAALAHYPRQLQLESPFGNFAVDVGVSSTVPPVDVLWITVKATQLDSALAALSDGTDVGAIVPLLNGIDHIGMLRAKYGADRVIPATIAVESERVAPGHIVHQSPFARLNVSSKGRTLLGPPIEQLQRLGFTCSFIDDEPTLLWSKLVFLAPVALNTTAADRAVGQIRDDPKLWSKLQSAVREACAVAVKEGANVDADAVSSIIKNLPPGSRSSMQKDVEKGNPPELDAIGGPVLRGARRHGIQIPVTEELIATIKLRIGEPKTDH
jgi:2-dehydropantoate 2-reductase